MYVIAYGVIFPMYLPCVSHLGHIRVMFVSCLYYVGVRVRSCL